MAEPSEVLPEPGWFVADLVSTLVLAGDCTRLVERWSVVAEVPLDELLVELNVDGTSRSPVGRVSCGHVPYGGAEVDAHGAEVTADVWPSSGGRRIVDVRLPRPLLPGETHAFDLTLRLPRSHRLGRHVVIPVVPFRRLELRVHFGRPGVPVAVRRIGGTPGADGAPVMVGVDRAGDVAAGFTDLLPGLEYGVGW